MQRHPPFNALRAVEAAVRNRSYSAAARELQVTHAAISQAVKRLETEFGLKLFERSGQSMEPSDVAVRMAKAYSEARSTIYRSLGDIMEQPAPTRVTVAMPSDFGRFWFAPRIDAVSRANPGLTIEIRTSTAGDVGSDGVDIALGGERVELAGWTSEMVAEIVLFPVCSPDFMARQGGISARHMSDLPLLAEKRWPWSFWFDAVGQKRARISHNLVFDDANVTLDAAVRGHGVALAHAFHAEEYLRQGLLVAPLKDVAPTPDRLYLNWRNDHNMQIGKLATWLRQALNKSAAFTGNMLPSR
jgi:DNA-binding transcriptional LysR family regulator